MTIDFATNAVLQLLCSCALSCTLLAMGAAAAKPNVVILFVDGEGTHVPPRAALPGS